MLCSTSVHPRFSLFSSCWCVAPPNSSSFTSCSRAPFAPAPIFCSIGSPSTPVERLKCKPSGEDPTEGLSSVASEELHGGRSAPGQDGKKEEEDAKEGGNEAISGIYVPRQKYIPIPKGELLDGILSMFESKEEAERFRRFAKCLDSFLHAEHKEILEQMRIYYTLIHSNQERKSCMTEGRSEESMGIGNKYSNDNFVDLCLKDKNGKRLAKFENPHGSYNGLDLQSLFSSSFADASADSNNDLRHVATSFQQIFMKLLRNAQFEELSVDDLLLTHALNTDYLLTLPIYVDWKKASESNAVIFRRGYATEGQKGFLIIEKLDYLQSKLLQEILFNISRPLKMLGIWIDEVLRNSSQTKELGTLVERCKSWMKKQAFPQNMYSFTGGTNNDLSDVANPENSEVPIWLASQRAASRYEGFFSSIGPRGRLVKKLLTWTGFIPPLPEETVELDDGSKESESYLRPNFLPRITLTDIWKPASKESCGNNLWKMFRSGVSILFSRSILQEPAFQELILLYTEDGSCNDSQNAEGMPFQLKIYERIPYPDLPVIFPHKKLSFRILDTVRLDIASIVGLLAFFVNYKFENILTSPSAVFLDIVAVSALILYVTRVALGYKQTWNRYQLLVNRTLYEKTLASGFGSIHFLLDASEQQQYKEAILAYAILLHSEKYQVSSCKSLSDACERFMYDMFREKVEMPVDEAIDMLLRLDIVSVIPINGGVGLKAVSCLKAYEALRYRWDSLL